MSQQIVYCRPEEYVTISKTVSSEVSYNFLNQEAMSEKESDFSLLSIINKMKSDEELADNIKEAMKENRKIKLKTPDL